MADLDARAFIRKGKSLIPADFVSEEWLQTIPEGKEILLDWRKARHVKNHRHYFAILRLAVEHIDAYDDTDALLDALKIACSHVRPVMKADGEMIFLPKSINFASLGEEEFKRFKNRSLFVLSKLLGFDATELLPEIDARNARIATGHDDRPEPPASAYEDDPPPP